MAVSVLKYYKVLQAAKNDIELDLCQLPNLIFITYRPLTGINEIPFKGIPSFLKKIDNKV